jgi:Protein of unknown function (DUF3375)
MKAIKAIEDFRRLHKRTGWELLSATNAPEVLGILKVRLFDKERRLPASVFVERVAMDLEDLRAQGQSWPQTARQYIHYWLTRGYLERSMAPGVIEEDYELTPGAIDAIRFVGGMDRPQTAATESRLSLVMKALSALADDTDTDKARRIERLTAERDRIDGEIAAVAKGHLRILPHDAAVERVREIIMLAADLTSDFRHVRDSFNQLHRELRERILSHEGGRGEVLEETFAGLDQIRNSDPGRTFSAFWSLLNDPSQSDMLDDAVADILGRGFTDRISPDEKRFLRGLKRDVLQQNQEVEKEFDHFRSSLTNYVQSADYLEQRLLDKLIRKAENAAKGLKNDIKPYTQIPFRLALTATQVSSFSQLKLRDANRVRYSASMEESVPAELFLDDIREMVAMSEIDFRSLRSHIAQALQKRSQATVGEVLEIFPAEQGLGSVLGLLDLGCRYGMPGDRKELVRWRGSDGAARTAIIPAIHFVEGKFDEPARI